MRFDLLHIITILLDVSVAAFLIWRATCKKATLWGAARFIYGFVAVLTLYHAGVYAYTLFLPAATEHATVSDLLHYVVQLYMLNPLLIAIIHWRGGHL
jgi:hypothetical protein